MAIILAPGPKGLHADTEFGDRPKRGIMRIPRRYGRRFLIGAAVAAAAVPAALVPLSLAAPSGATAVGTVTWTGNGTTDGQCDNMNEGLTNVPDNEQGW